MCITLQVSRSGYYKWLQPKSSKRTLANASLLNQIRTIHAKSKCTYGSPRITIELSKQGCKASKPHVARLMKLHGIRSKIKKTFKTTTNSKHPFQVSPNLLKRRFKVGEIGKVWVSDITYIKTSEGWLYLTTVIDLGDRKVIGWSLSSTLKAIDTVVRAWKMAAINRPIQNRLIFHSDRGVQYACDEFRDVLKAHPSVKQSMSRKGDCWDNAVAESFFKTLKIECTNDYKFKTINQASIVVFDYIETWYNTKRLHSSLGYKSPDEFLENQLIFKPAA